MKKPNFFIIGAPKSGTTALASYLSAHPEVFMADPKEPHHYNTDLRHGSFKNREKYLSLFEQAGPQHAAVGEASVWYLYSRIAVSNILADVPDARFIVMLRNPVDMAPSLHEQMVFSGYETERDFKKAWEIQELRKEGHQVPFWCEEPLFLLYQEACCIGAQYERVADIVPEANLLPIIFDDFKNDTRAVWLDVLRFLGVSDDGRTDFPVVNSAKARRSLFVKKINDAYCRLRLSAGFEGFGTGLFSKIDKWNFVSRDRKALDEDLILTLENVFKDDVALLERSIRRDLREWGRGR